MSMTDPVADMLTRVRNAMSVGHPAVAMPNSKLKVEIARILKEEGFIAGYEVVDGASPAHKVLRMRFGIDMNTDHTLEEVGKQFDVTRERIRQIEAKALRKLRHPSRSDQLRSFLLED